MLLITTRTALHSKNERTKEAKNYRPIACQSILFKIYTGILNSFVQDHCQSNGIITDEQAGGKSGSWGCMDQLLINKAINEDVKKNRKNLFTIWLDYQNAFVSVSHKWLIQALKLAKLPDDLIEAIYQLTKCWQTKATLETLIGSIETEIIKYLRGMLQGHSLSVILFILTLNPLSFLLRKTKGYKIKNVIDLITHFSLLMI